MPFLQHAVGAWDQLEPSALRMLLKLALVVSLTLASPFFGLSILFALLEKPFLWWIAIPLSVGVMIVALGLVAWAILRAKLRQLRAHLGRAAAFEGAITVGPSPMLRER